MKHTIQEIQEQYDLELEKIIKTIKKKQAKIIVLQFPDALKPSATVISEYIEQKTNCKCLVWFGSCFGGCDIPMQLDFVKAKIDLLIQFGHSPWKFKTKNIKVLK